MSLPNRNDRRASIPLTWEQILVHQCQSRGPRVQLRWRTLTPTDKADQHTPCAAASLSHSSSVSLLRWSPHFRMFPKLTSSGESGNLLGFAKRCTIWPYRCRGTHHLMSAQPIGKRLNRRGSLTPRAMSVLNPENRTNLPCPIWDQLTNWNHMGAIISTRNRGLTQLSQQKLPATCTSLSSKSFNAYHAY